MRRLPPMVAVIAAAMLLMACGADDERAEPVVVGGGDVTAPQATATEGCTDVSEPDPKGEQDLRPPQAQLDPARTYTAVVKTNCGTFEIELDAMGAPRTAASFASLVERGFFDGLGFHRIVPGFVVQGGDPLGTGGGGPGYSVVEAPPDDATYARGTVAMAKTELEDPGTSGSQFFVVTGSDAGLPPDYAIVGEVVEGMNVVDRIEAVPADAERPIAPVVMEEVTLRES